MSLSLPCVICLNPCQLALTSFQICVLKKKYIFPSSTASLFFTLIPTWDNNLDNKNIWKCPRYKSQEKFNIRSPYYLHLKNKLWLYLVLYHINLMQKSIKRPSFTNVISFYLCSKEKHVEINVTSKQIPKLFSLMLSIYIKNAVESLR